MQTKDLLIGGMIAAVMAVLIILPFTLERIPCTREDPWPGTYQCYSVLSGSQGALPIETIGGDLLCHKSCFDLQCPALQVCRSVNRCRASICETLSLCFSVFDSVPTVVAKLGD
jgi:hypothetical protein